MQKYFCCCLDIVPESCLIYHDYASKIAGINWVGQKIYFNGPKPSCKKRGGLRMIF